MSRIPHNHDFSPKLPKQKEELHDLIAEIKRFIDEHGGDAVNVPNTPLVDIESYLRFLHPALAEFLLAGKGEHPALGLVGELFKATSKATTATISALQQNMWIHEEDEPKENMEELLKKGEQNFIR
jgi:hypothetical protein